MKKGLLAIMFMMGLAVMLWMTIQENDVQARLSDQNVVDCSDAALKSAQRELRRQIEPFLYTSAEEYSGNPQVLAEKETGRNKILVQWIKMRCVCNKGMSDFEKTLCLAMKQNLAIGDEDSCLIRY